MQQIMEVISMIERVRQFADLFCMTIVIFFLLFPSNLSADDKRVYVYSWEPWEPYQIVDKTGKLTGLDINIIEAVLDNMGEPYKWQKTPWKRVLKDMDEGFLDGAPGASITDERKQWAWFSDTYRQELVVLFVQKGKKELYPFETLTDIIKSDITIGVARGYYYGEGYKKLIKNEAFARRIEKVKVNELNYKKLALGRIDGFLCDPVAATAGLKSLDMLDMVEIHPMKVYADDVHVMFSKKRVPWEYVRKFNKSLAELKESGEYDKILGRYLELDQTIILNQRDGRGL